MLLKGVKNSNTLDQLLCMYRTGKKDLAVQCMLYRYYNYNNIMSRKYSRTLGEDVVELVIYETMISSLEGLSEIKYYKTSVNYRLLSELTKLNYRGSIAVIDYVEYIEDYRQDVHDIFSYTPPDSINIDVLKGYHYSIMRYYISGYSVAEIAVIIGLSVNTIYYLIRTLRSNYKTEDFVISYI